MTDREALAAAMERIEQNDHWLDGAPSSNALRAVLTAARERLAQMAETCGTCGGRGSEREIGPDCLTCHGRGTVYPPALVERARRGLLKVAGEVASDGSFWCPDINAAAVAVLDALNDGEIR